MNRIVRSPLKRFLFLGVRRGLALFKKSSTSKFSKSCYLFTSEARVSWSSMFSELLCSMLPCVVCPSVFRRSALFGVVPANRTLHLNCPFCSTLYNRVLPVLPPVFFCWKRCLSISSRQQPSNNTTHCSDS